MQIIDKYSNNQHNVPSRRLRTGFNEIFPLTALEAFSEAEVEVLLCGAGEKWTTQVRPPA